MVDDGGERAGGEGTSRRKVSNWGIGDSREGGSYQFCKSQQIINVQTPIASSDPDITHRWDPSPRSTQVLAGPPLRLILGWRTEHPVISIIIQGCRVWGDRESVEVGQGRGLLIGHDEASSFPFHVSTPDKLKVAEENNKLQCREGLNRGWRAKKVGPGGCSKYSKEIEIGDKMWGNGDRAMECDDGVK